MQAGSQLEPAERQPIVFDGKPVAYLMDQRPGIERCLGGATIIRPAPPGTVLGNVTLGQLRNTKVVVLPKGLRAVGEAWFVGSGIEEVVIPKGVAEIQTAAFAHCARLRQVSFASQWHLKKIGPYAF